MTLLGPRSFVRKNEAVRSGHRQGSQATTKIAATSEKFQSFALLSADACLERIACLQQSFEVLPDFLPDVLPAPDLVPDFLPDIE